MTDVSVKLKLVPMASTGTLINRVGYLGLRFLLGVKRNHTMQGSDIATANFFFFSFDLFSMMSE